MIQAHYLVQADPASNVFTLYLKNGKRVLVSGPGTVVDVAKRLYPANEIAGSMPGDDHSRRWNPDRLFWERMTIDYE